MARLQVSLTQTYHIHISPEWIDLIVSVIWKLATTPSPNNYAITLMEITTDKESAYFEGENVVPIGSAEHSLNLLLARVRLLIWHSHHEYTLQVPESAGANTCTEKPRRHHRLTAVNTNVKRINPLYDDSLTHWGRHQTGAISQTTFSSAFSWMKMFQFRIKFHWRLFLRVLLTIFQHWFRWWLGAVQATSHYLNQWWLVYWRIYALLCLNELRYIIYRQISNISRTESQNSNVSRLVLQLSLCNISKQVEGYV